MLIRDKEYEEVVGIRRSLLWNMHITPMHFFQKLCSEPKTTKALDFGIAAHMYILENFKFYQKYTFIPRDIDRRTKQGKEAYDKLVMTGKELLSADDWDRVYDMGEALEKNDEAVALLKGAHEQIYQWTDPETGEVCKVKIDCLTRFNGQLTVVDYKTTDSCDERAFRASARKYGYKFQAGMYAEGVENDMLEQVRFAFIAQEKNPPYATRVFYCDDDYVKAGKLEFHNLLRRYHNCMVSGEWPGYESAVLLEEDYD